MPKYELTDEAKAVARLLHERVIAGKLKRDLQYGIDEDLLDPYNETTEENKDLCVNEGGPMSYGELLELVQNEFLSERVISRYVHGFRILQRLHEAVTSDFEIPGHLLGTQINIPSSSDAPTIVNINSAYIQSVSTDTSALADLLTDKLRTVLQAENAFIFSALDELRNAVSENDKKTAMNKVWEGIGRSADLLTLGQLLAGVGQIIGTVINL